jgi:hypothetical protein
VWYGNFNTTQRVLSLDIVEGHPPCCVVLRPDFGSFLGRFCETKIENFVFFMSDQKEKRRRKFDCENEGDDDDLILEYISRNGN